MHAHTNGSELHSPGIKAIDSSSGVSICRQQHVVALAVLVDSLRTSCMFFWSALLTAAFQPRSSFFIFERGFDVKALFCHPQQCCYSTSLSWLILLWCFPVHFILRLLG